MRVITKAHIKGVHQPLGDLFRSRLSDDQWRLCSNRHYSSWSLAVRYDT